LQLETERNLDLGAFDAAQEVVDEYLRSVGDALPIYEETGIVPPLYLAASALGSLLRKLALPPGAIHSLQEVATLTPVAIGSEIKVSAMLEKPRRRAGLEFITAVCNVESGGTAVLTSKSTVLLTSGGPSEETPPKGTPKEQSGQGIKAAESGLPVISKKINQEQLNAYAKASGDDNPLHLDPEFATGTQFGGIIAHGMLTLAFVSEMMAAAHGRDWLESGALRVRFKGAAYIGDRLEARGNLAKEQGPSQTYSVGVWNSASGRELISGTAGFKLNHRN
jgi:acyl dehydratase